MSRIMICTQSYYPYENGVAEVTTNLAEQFVKNGHEVTVATEAHIKRNRQITLNGVNIISLDIKGNYLSGIKGNDVKNYIELVLSNQFDLINIHCAQIWVFDVLINYLAQIKTKVIFTSHGLSLINYEIFKDYKSQLEKGLQSVWKIVCLSAMLEDYNYYSGKFKNKLSVIPNGVHPEHLKYLSNKGIPEIKLRKQKYIINVSNHNAAKNHSLFFEVSRRLRNQTFVNIGNPNYVERFKIAKSFRIKSGCYYACTFKSLFHNNVILFKNLKRENVLSLLSNSTLFLFTSRLEQFPIAILEAMALGIPWISTGVGNVKSLEGGLIYKDAEDAVRKIEYLLKDDKKYKELSLQGMKAVEQKYTWNSIAKQYQHLFNNAM